MRQAVSPCEFPPPSFKEFSTNVIGSKDDPSILYHTHISSTSSSSSNKHLFVLQDHRIPVSDASAH